MNSTTDWYNSTRLSDGVVSIHGSTKSPPSRAFLVRSDYERILIDTGRGVGDLLGYLDAEFAVPEQVLLTHSHWDHIGNAHQFDDVFIQRRERSPDGWVTIDVLSDEFVDRPGTFMEEQRREGTMLPFDFDSETFTSRPVSDVGVISSGSLFEVGEKELEIIEIPGHSPGQIAVLDRDAGILFGADIIHIERNLFANFQNSNVDDYVDSFRTVIGLRDSGTFDILATTHNEPIVGEELHLLDDLLEGFERITEGELEFETVRTPWGDARQYFVGDSKVLTKTCLD